MFRMNGMLRCHGWQGAAMFRMNGQVLCSRQNLSTYIHVSNAAALRQITYSRRNLSTCFHARKGKEQRCSGLRGASEVWELKPKATIAFLSSSFYGQLGNRPIGHRLQNQFFYKNRVPESYLFQV